MNPINEVYPDKYWCSYNPLLESFGYPILLQVDDCDYQGDSRLLFQNGDLRGILIFGWGSCSGCDALQGCDTIDEVAELRDRLHDGIRWGSVTGTLDYLRTHDWAGDYSNGDGKTAEFVEQAIALLS